MSRHPAPSSIVTVLLLFAACCTVGAEPAGNERTLKSGARAVFVSQPGGGAVLVAAAVRAGAADEPAVHAGLSHFLEHLLFDGYDALDERAVTEAFERRAAYVNAFTRDETTVYFALAPREHAAAVAEMLAAMLTRSTIPPAAFEKEKKVILEELAREAASPPIARGNAERAALWAGTPWEHAVGGTPETIGAIAREDVVRFWKEHYRPERMRVLVLGELAPEALGAVLRPFDELAPAPKGAPAPAARPDPLGWPGWGTWRAIPLAGGEPELSLVVAMDARGGALEALARGLGGPAGPIAQALGARALTVDAARVAREARELLEIRIGAAPGEAPGPLLAAALGAVQSAGRAGLGDAELAQALRAWRNERLLSRQRLQYAAVLEGEGLAAARGSLAEELDAGRADAAAVRAALAELAGARSRVRAVWAGDGGPAAPEPLPEPAAAPAAPARALQAGPGGSRVATLANGLVLGVQQEPGSGVFGVHLLVADRAARENVPGAADVLHRLIGSGSVLGDGPALHRRLERLGVEMKTADEPSIPFDDRYHVPEYSYIRMEGPADALPEALQLLAESIRAPRWDARAWEEALSGHRESRRAGGRGSARVETELRASLLGATSPLARPPSGPADGEPPSEAAVRDLLGTWPAGYFAPSSLVLTVASPLPAEDVLERVGDLFGGGPDAAPRRVQYEIAAGAPTPPAAKSAGPSTGGPMGPQVALGWGRIVQVADAERPALTAALDALSDLMTAELREKAGLIYRHEAGARALPGGALMIQVGLSTRPENRDEAATRLRALLQQLGSSELPAEEVARLAARAERREMLDRLAAGARAYRLGVRLFNGTTGSDAAGAPRDAARIREAARRYLAPDGLVQVGP